MNVRVKPWMLGILTFCLLLQGCKAIRRPADSAASDTNAGPDVTTSANAPLTLTLLGQETPARNSPIEFAITGLPSATNPFDPAEVDLQLTFVGPEGATAAVGGFWYQEYAPDTLHTHGDPGWRARFTPQVSGEWRVSALVKPSELSSSEIRFTVAESAAPGFVHVDPAHRRYFAYQDGSRFLPVGVNMGWWDDDPIGDYTRWLDHFAANGGNTIRVWMANWAFALEWNDTTLGDYRTRLKQAWLLDELLRLAGERGIKVILVLNHHGQFSTTVNPQWQENPYNAALGGPLAAPDQFASDPTAIAFFQRRLRYIIDRWGSSPSLLAWEWWNEYNFTPIDDAQMEPWLETMGAYLSNRDPYHHPVTISGPAGADSPIWQLPSIDFVSVHIYTTEDPLFVAAELEEEYAPAVPDKPLLLAEFGFATGTEGADSFDQTGIHLHNGLWATLFSGHAGTGMYWWWDTYIEPLNLWHHYAGITNFLGKNDPAEFTPGKATIVAAVGKSAGAEGLLLEAADKRLLWVRSKQYTAAAANEAYDKAIRAAIRSKQKLESYTYTPTPIQGHRVELTGIEDGTYEVHWYDPQSGAWGEIAHAQAENGTISIPLPAFSQDIAAAIRPVP